MGMTRPYIPSEDDGPQMAEVPKWPYWCGGTWDENSTTGKYEHRHPLFETRLHPNSYHKSVVNNVIMKTQQDEDPRYCQQNRNNGHAFVTSLGRSHVEGSDPYHSAQQVHGEESYLDESNKKLLNFQGLREMQVHKKNATGPYFEPHGSSPYIYATCLKNDFRIILLALALSPMCNFLPSRIYQLF
jgi:hypothetical protein